MSPQTSYVLELPFSSKEAFRKTKVMRSFSSGEAAEATSEPDCLSFRLVRLARERLPPWNRVTRFTSMSSTELAVKRNSPILAWS
jgi:hypothetical protein